MKAIKQITMRYKFKIISKLPALTVFIMLTNCSKDEFEEGIKNSNKNKRTIYL